MAVNTVSGIEQSDNWQLIATNTPSAASSSSFTSISGYKTLMVFFTLTQSASDTLRMAFNSDTTGANYGGTAQMYYSYGSWNASNPYIPLIGYTSAPSENSTGYAIINNATQSFPKTISGAGSKMSIIGGVYSGSAVTSVTIDSGSGTITGTIKLYGIAA